MFTTPWTRSRSAFRARPRVVAANGPRAARWRRKALTAPERAGAAAGGAGGGGSQPRAHSRRSHDPDAQSAAAAVASSRDALRVMLCDDHAVVRAGLRRLLDSVDGIDVVGIAADACGYVLKDATPAELVEAIRSAARDAGAPGAA